MVRRVRITATSYDGEQTLTETFADWWFEGKLVMKAEEVASDFFYTAFDKQGHHVDKKEEL